MNETEATEKLPFVDSDRINDFAEEFPIDSPTVNTSHFSLTTDIKVRRRRRQEETSRKVRTCTTKSCSFSRKRQSPNSAHRITKTLEHAAPGPQLLPRRPFEFSENDAITGLMNIETQHDPPSALSHEEDSSHSAPADTTATPATLYLNNRDSEVTNYSNYNHFVITPGAYAVSMSGYFSDVTVTTSTRSAPDLLQDTSLSETSTRVSTTRAGTVNEESHLQEEELDELTSAAGAYSVHCGQHYYECDG